MLIRVFGSGCATCREAEKVVVRAVRQANSPATVENITDLREMLACGILSTPAVVIDGAVMCTGRVPSRSEVMGWIAARSARGLAGGEPTAPSVL